MVTSESQKSVGSGGSSNILGPNTWERIQNQMKLFCNHMEITTSSMGNSYRQQTPNHLSSPKRSNYLAFPGAGTSMFGDAGVTETIPSKNTIQAESQGTSERNGAPDESGGRKLET